MCPSGHRGAGSAACAGAACENKGRAAPHRTASAVVILTANLNTDTSGNYRIGSFWPLARIMWVVCSDPAAFDPSFARAAASTVTLSPILTVSRFQPPRVNAYGGPISILKLRTAPLSSLESIKTNACGFTQSSFVTVPEIVAVFFESYSASNEWWAVAGFTLKSIKLTAANEPIAFSFIVVL